MLAKSSAESAGFKNSNWSYMKKGLAPCPKVIFKFLIFFYLEGLLYIHFSLPSPPLSIKFPCSGLNLFQNRLFWVSPILDAPLWPCKNPEDTQLQPLGTGWEMGCRGHLQPLHHPLKTQLSTHFNPWSLEISNTPQEGLPTQGMEWTLAASTAISCVERPARSLE